MIAVLCPYLKQMDMDEIYIRKQGGSMRCRVIFILLMTLVLVTGCVGCSDKGDVRVYDDTEEVVVTHDEKSMTAVITAVDLEHDIVGVMDCISGGESSLIYHGGVVVTDAYGETIGIGSISVGMPADVVYYADTARLVSISVSTNVETRKNVSKFAADKEQGKATYRGTSCSMSDFVKAFDGDTEIDISEINTEDEVTLYLYSGRLVSAVIELGHGYVRLNNQDTYVGGMVEIGYDVIVPVTSDMLLTVREGEYTLRINKDGYNGSKQVTVTRGQETTVNLQDIAIPTGSAAFETEPADAEIYVEGSLLEGNVYTALYGIYSLRVEADGYKTFRGSFRIDDTVSTFSISLTELEDASEETEDETTSSDTSSSGSTTATEDSTTSETAAAEGGDTTGNSITVKAPVGVGVYVDGDYVGTAPVSFPKVTGTHTITLYQSGFLIKSYTIQATDDGKDDEYSYPELTSLLDLVE